MTPIAPTPSGSGPGGVSGRPARRTRTPQLPIVVWLTVVWVALWGELSMLNVVSGVVVAVVVMLVFPLPRLQMRVHVRPLWLAWLVVHFLWDVVVASYEVAVKTLAFRHAPRNAVIEVDLRSSSDFVLTLVALMITLVPGSLVMEVRGATHTLFLHVLDVGDRAGADAFRAKVFELERRVVLALGADKTVVQDPPPEQEGTP